MRLGATRGVQFEGVERGGSLQNNAFLNKKQLRQKGGGNNMTYNEAINNLDKITDDLQNTLLALASYDWYFFNDMRIYDLKQDYGIKADNKHIFRYYHTNSNDKHIIDLNNQLYVKRYKKYLSYTLTAL